MSPTREQDYDGPWKSALELAFEPFLALFLEDLHAIVDWSKDHIARDQELQKLLAESATGVRRVDKLFEAVRKGTGDPRFFHIEAQAQQQKEHEFGERMYVYNYRGRDLLGQPLISIAVLGDDDPKWHPREYHEGEHGSELTFTFRTVKLLDWAARQAELEAGENVFGLFVSAHLEALKTRDDADRRAGGKVRLLSNLAKRDLSDLDRGKWYQLIDWLLPLPRDKEQQVYQQLKGDHPMTFITYAEQVGIEKGIEKGIEQGIEKGIEKGIEQGIEKGIEKGARETLRAVLKGKFGQEGEALLAQLPEQVPVPRLEELAVLVAVTATVDDLRPHFTRS